MSRQEKHRQAKSLLNKVLAKKKNLHSSNYALLSKVQYLNAPRQAAFVFKLSQVFEEHTLVILFPCADYFCLSLSLLMGVI